MPQQQKVNPLDSVKSLLRMSGSSNMTPTGDKYFDKRRQQIIGGDDELAPSQLEQHLVQDELGGTYSRDMIRDAGISTLKRKLGLIGAEAQAKIQPEIIRGEYGVRAARESAVAAENRRQASANDSFERQERSQNSMMERLEKTLGATSARQEDRQQHDIDNPNAGRGVTQGTLTQLQKVREGMPGNPLTRYFGGDAANERLKGALANVLEQRGTLGPVSKAAAALKAGEQLNEEEQQWLQTLGPYEQEYLKLLSGK